MIPQRTVRPSVASDSEQLDPWLLPADIPAPQLATLGLHPVARKLLLISHPAEGQYGVAVWSGSSSSNMGPA